MQSTILDVAIGLMFAYLLLALLCSGIQEWIAHLLDRRAEMLEKGIRNLLGDVPVVAGASRASALLSDLAKRHGLAHGAKVGASISWFERRMKAVLRMPGKVLSRKSVAPPTQRVESLADIVLRHAVIVAMGKEGKAPSYVPAQAFAVAVTDSIKSLHDQRGPPLSQAFVANLVALKPLNDALTAATTGTVADLQKARQSLEQWFDQGMERVSGWYKRETRVFMIAIGVVLAVVFNVDSIDLAQRLYADPMLRDAAASSASKYVAKSDGARTPQQVNTALGEQKKALDVFKLPAGWGETLPETPHWTLSWALRILGWALTALAVSLGAPFWFDLLSKLAPLRSAGKAPDKSPPTAPGAGAAAGGQQVAQPSTGTSVPRSQAFTEDDLSPYDVKDIQKRIGMSAPTGAIDTQTRNLIGDYQKMKSYEPTGVITADLATELLSTP